MQIATKNEKFSIINQELSIRQSELDVLKEEVNLLVARNFKSLEQMREEWESRFSFLWLSYNCFTTKCLFDHI